MIMTCFPDLTWVPAKGIWKREVPFGVDAKGKKKYKVIYLKGDGTRQQTAKSYGEAKVELQRKMDELLAVEGNLHNEKAGKACILLGNLEVNPLMPVQAVSALSISDAVKEFIRYNFTRMENEDVRKVSFDASMSRGASK